MKAVMELIGSIVQILIYVVIFVLQVVAPLLTLVFLVITYINSTSTTMTMFYVSTILYFVGYFTSSLGLKSVVPTYEKSHVDRHHPLLSNILNMAVLFLPSFIFALIICLIIGDFTYFLHNAIMANWFYRLIIYFMKRNEHVQSNNNLFQNTDDNSNVTIKELLENFANANTTIQYYEIHQIAENIYIKTKNADYEKICKLTMLGDQVLTNLLNLSEDELIEKRMQIDKILSDFDFGYKNSKLPKTEESEELVSISDSDDNDDFDLNEFFKSRTRELVFTAETMAIEYNLLRDKKKLPINAAMLGAAILSESLWIESGITNIREVTLDFLDAIEGRCMVGEYERKHSNELEIEDYENVLVNLVMSVSCSHININKPQIESSKVVNYIISNKSLIKTSVKEALKNNYSIDSLFIFITKANFENNYPKYEDLLESVIKK